MNVKHIVVPKLDTKLLKNKIQLDRSQKTKIYQDIMLKGENSKIEIRDLLSVPKPAASTPIQLTHDELRQICDESLQIQKLVMPQNTFAMDTGSQPLSPKEVYLPSKMSKNDQGIESRNVPPPNTRPKTFQSCRYQRQRPIKEGALRSNYVQTQQEIVRQRKTMEGVEDKF